MRAVEWADDYPDLHLIESDYEKAIPILNRFPEQFQGGPYFLGTIVGLGWLPIVRAVCREIESALKPDEMNMFQWSD